MTFERNLYLILAAYIWPTIIQYLQEQFGFKNKNSFAIKLFSTQYSKAFSFLCKIYFDSLKCFSSREFYLHNNEKDIGLKTVLDLKPKTLQCMETNVSIKGNLFDLI